MMLESHMIKTYPGVATLDMSSLDMGRGNPLV